jgi:hypothetical protein
LDVYIRDYLVRELPKTGADLLLSIVPKSTTPGVDGYVPPGGGDWTMIWPDVPIILNGVPRNVGPGWNGWNDSGWITDDLRVLRSEELLPEVRRIASIPGLSDRCTLILLPGSETRRLALDAEWLEVSLNEETYKAARAWSSSADRDMAWCGAEVISHENTKENAEALLQFARADVPATDYYTASSIATILAILKRWGVARTPGLIRPTGSPLDPGAWQTWASLAVMAAAPGIYCLLRRRRIRWMTLLALMIASIVGVMIIRSYWPQDAVSGGNYEAATERGWFYLWNHGREKNGVPCPLVFCRPADLLRWSELNIDGTGRLNGLGDMLRGFRDAPRKNFADGPGNLFFPGFGFKRPWYGVYRGEYLAVPLWLAGACAVAPWALWMMVGAASRWRGRRRRGFPVEMK